jgi:hypothetical protein
MDGCADDVRGHRIAGPKPERRALLSAARGGRSLARQSGRELCALRRRRRHLRAHRLLPGRVESSGGGAGERVRRAGIERRALGRAAFRAQCHGGQRPTGAFRRSRSVGRAHARGGRRCGPVQIRSAAAPRPVHRGKHHARPAMGHLRAERPVAVGAHPHERCGFPACFGKARCRATSRRQRFSCAATPRP